MNFHQVLACASGPTRLQTSLRRLTRSVRSGPAVMPLQHAAESPLPMAVYGGDVLALFGERLRDALPSAKPSASSRTVPARRERRWQAPASAGGSWEALDPDRLSQLGRSGAPEIPMETAGGGWPPAASPQASGGDSYAPAGTAVPDSSVGSSHEGRLTPSAPDAERLAYSAASPALAASRDDLAPASALERRLAVYWARQARAKAHQAQSRWFATPGPPHATPQRAGPGAAPTEEPARRRSWPAGVGDEAARSLARHLGREHEASFILADSKRYDAAPERVEIQNVFHVTPPASQVAGPPADLADALADVLREQARRHGIDVDVPLP